MDATSPFVGKTAPWDSCRADGGAMETAVLRALVDANEAIDTGVLADTKGWDHSVLVGVVKSLAAHQMVELQVRTGATSGFLHNQPRTRQAMKVADDPNRAAGSETFEMGTHR